jgi:hypothetical protein
MPNMLQSSDAEQNPGTAGAAIIPMFCPICGLPICEGLRCRVMDLSGADLSIAILHKADMTGTNLRGADLSAVDLRSGVLYNAANLTIEQLCSVKSLWLTELNEWRSEAEKHCRQVRGSVGGSIERYGCAVTYASTVDHLLPGEPTVLTSPHQKGLSPVS